MPPQTGAPGHGDRRHRPEPALIPRIHPRGSRLAGLLYYLFGPGKQEEHVNPRLVAAWNGAGDLADLQPPRTADGKPSLKQLIDLLEQPVRAGRRPPDKHVWHCSLRNHPDDPALSDEQWGRIAADMMAGVALAPHDDPHAVRWIAVRHDDTGIHLVATLVRQDGRTAWAWNDKPRSRTTATELEHRHGLRPTAPADRTTHPRPSAPERNKTARTGRADIPRDRLRREVRAAAAAAEHETAFFDHLHHAGLLVRLRHSTREPDQVTGYAVGLPEHTTTDGHPIWYGGGTLAPDLTLPKLRHRWRQPTGTPPAADATPRPHPFTRAARIAGNAAADLARSTHNGDHDTATAIGQAAADLLTTTAYIVQRRHHGPLTHAAETLDRAARQPHGQPPPRHPRADQLRAMARLIAGTKRLTHDRDLDTALHLLQQLTALSENLATLREAQQRRHQARAALHTATTLRNVHRDGAPRQAAQAPVPVPRGSPATSWTPAGRPARR